MKRFVLCLLVVAVVGMAGCGGGGGSSSGEFDPTGSEWQFLVSSADAGDTMYTLTFFDSNGNRAVSGVFTAVSAAGASYSGSWASSDSVVTGASSGNFAFTLNVNDDTTTGTIDYITAEGSGSAAATRVDSTASGCSQYVGNWVGSGKGANCAGEDRTAELGDLRMTVGSDCVATLCVILDSGSICENSQIVDNAVSFTLQVGEEQCSPTSVTLGGRFTSSSSVSGSVGGAVQGTWSATKQ